MISNNDSKWKLLRNFIDGYLEAGKSYRAGAIYEAYLGENGMSSVTRKDFEMFLRDQVIKDDGLLKRTSHGVYEIRTDPNDRGVSFSRGSNTGHEMVGDVSDLCDATNLPNATLDEALDESVDLTTKMMAIFDKLNNQDGISFTAQNELGCLKSSVIKHLDSAITDITAVMAWCEDNIEIPDESESMNMGGI